MRKLKRFETVCVEITNQGVKEKGIVLNECPWLELWCQYKVVDTLNRTK